MNGTPLRKRICLVLAYLGPWPSYFSLFLHSCRFNRDVDFLIVGDHPLPDVGPLPNVRVVPTSKHALAQRIADAVCTPVNLSIPYKICDFRPAFGHVFARELFGYDFWGHCDSDMILGRIRQFVTDDVLERFDKVLMRGNLSLYRNTQATNDYYRLQTPGIDFRRVFADPVPRVFDEWQGIAKILDHHGIAIFHDEFIANVHPGHYDLRAEKIVNYHTQAFVWDSGRILQLFENGGEISDRELGWIHLQKRPMAAPAFPVDDTVERFAICPRSFEQIEHIQLTPRDLETLNTRIPGFHFFWWILRPYNRMARLVRDAKTRRVFPASQCTWPSKTQLGSSGATRVV